MPTSYAHYRFGQKVVGRLPEKYQYFAYEYPDYFYVGLHGPDLLFYLLTNKKVYELGEELHGWSGKKYFSMVGERILAEMAGDIPDRILDAKNVSELMRDVLYPKSVTALHSLFRHGVHPQSLLLGEPRDEYTGKWTRRSTERKMAYLFGFLCHYALDRTAHQYINAQVNAGVASHYLIEAEFDRLMMIMDGYDPLRHHVTDHIHPSMELAEELKPFFPGLHAADIYLCLRLQKMLLSGMNLPTRLPRRLFVAGCKAAGAGDFGELFMPEHPDPRCFATNEVLIRIFNDAIPEAVEMVTSLMDMLTGKKEWDEKFLWNFNGEKVE